MCKIGISNLYFMKNKYDLASVKKLARSRGGKFLSPVSKLIVKERYLWECSLGHEFTARLEDVDNGSWCRDCSMGLYERICRAHFEAIFKVRFPNTRNLDWLKNEHGNFIELDGYNKELGIAFEHQGKQHYYDTNWFSKPLYDDIKKELCKKNGVKLICIPELYTFIKIKKLIDFLKQEFIKNDITINNNIEFVDIDLSHAYSPKWLDEIKNLAKQNNFKLLSKVYIGHNERYDFACLKRNHKFSRAKYDLNECPVCRYEVKVFGKYYTNIEDACLKHNISYDAVTRRLRMHNETADEAIKALKLLNNKTYKINKKTFKGKTKKEICTYFDILPKSVDQLSRKKNLTFEQSCQYFIGLKKQTIQVNGIDFYTFSEAARYFKLNHEHLYLLKKKNGLTEEEAINQMLSNSETLRVTYNNVTYSSRREACKALNIGYHSVCNQMRRKQISVEAAINNVISNKKRRFN
jgi:hypothetical protein